LRTREGIIHDKATVHDKRDPDGRTPFLPAAGFEGQMKDGDVYGSGLS
jgi:hypothetical protein